MSILWPSRETHTPQLRVEQAVWKEFFILKQWNVPCSLPALCQADLRLYKVIFPWAALFSAGTLSSRFTTIQRRPPIGGTLERVEVCKGCEDEGLHNYRPYTQLV